MNDSNSDERVARVFRRVFRREFPDGDLAVQHVAGWDSLTHIKLVMELEREFGFDISPQEIPGLYSDTATVRRFVAARLEAAEKPGQ